MMGCYIILRSTATSGARNHDKNGNCNSPEGDNCTHRTRNHERDQIVNVCNHTPNELQNTYEKQAGLFIYLNTNNEELVCLTPIASSYVCTGKMLVDIGISILNRSTLCACVHIVHGIHRHV